jgi:hypothetical protein
MISPMMPSPMDDLQTLRSQIAAAAARMVAQDGADYGSAKRKAARQLLGDAAPAAHQLPDNAEVEAEVRLYHALFNAERQPARLAQLRTVALDIMEVLAPFSPYLTGSVLSGTAGEHDDIHLQLFVDAAKDVEIFLLNRKLTLDVSETEHFKGGRMAPVEVVSFIWQGEGVHAELYDTNDLRAARKLRADGSAARADRAALQALLAPPSTENPA